MVPGPHDKRPTDPGGWGCVLLLAGVGTLLLWIWQGLTWPVRALHRLFARWLK